MPQKGAAPRTPKPEVFRDMVSFRNRIIADDRGQIEILFDQQKKPCSSPSSSLMLNYSELIRFAITVTSPGRANL
jgi:hypothetical protein